MSRNKKEYLYKSLSDIYIQQKYIPYLSDKHFLYFPEILDLQLRLKDSLNMTWKNSLSHDWIPVEKAKTFPLREFYVGLRWVRVVKRAIQNFKQDLNSIYDILDMPDSTERPKFRKILLTGNPKDFR